MTPNPPLVRPGLMPLNTNDITYLEPWSPVGGQGAALEAELRRETGPGHPLYRRMATAVARRQDCDDVLFVTNEEPCLIVVVHLSWASRPEVDPAWPTTTIFPSLDDWVERGMKVDHQNFR